MAYEKAVFTRACRSLAIPQGFPIEVEAGREGVITQALGGNWTVMLDTGQMVRVEGKDADAIGKTPPVGTEGAAPSGVPGAAGGEGPATGAAGDTAGAAPPLGEAVVWDRLRSVFDPEIPVNIVELGLVYRCAVEPRPEGGSRVEVRMTMTAPGCGMGGTLKAEVEAKLAQLPGVAETDVELVWEPPWDPSRMSDAAKLQLGML